MPRGLRLRSRSRTKTLRAYRVLIVDDEPSQVAFFAETLVDAGYDVSIAHSVKRCLEALKASTFDGILIDVILPSDNVFSFQETRGGLKTGVSLARLIRRENPTVRLAGLSVDSTDDVARWFTKNASGLWPKHDRASERFVRFVDRLTGRASPNSRSRVFIVHGRAEREKRALRHYLRRRLKFEPIILAEQPDAGRTVIEKFESVANDIDHVFVLLTPDDVGSLRRKSGRDSWRARQNVIFELGYFYGKMQRRQGRVVLLHKGPLELPSDLAGIVYIDISNGIHDAERAIRRELEL